MIELSKIIGANIALHRRIKNISQKELGKALGVSAQQIFKYEKGTNDISVINLKFIAEVLEVSIADLITEELLNKSENPKVLNALRYIYKLEDEKILKLEEMIKILN